MKKTPENAAGSPGSGTGAPRQKGSPMMEEHIRRHWQELTARAPQWHDAEPAFAAAVRLLVRCARNGGKILLCGNGGSAADAEHIAGELMKGFLLPRPLPESWLRQAEERFPGHGEALRALQCGIAAVPLVSGVALPTAFANDVDGVLLFAQQVYALARPGDVLWAISTSGHSANVNHALRVARLLDCPTLGLSGRDGGEMASLLDVELRAPSRSTHRIQELHLPMYHALCACVEACLFARSPSDATENAPGRA